MKTTNRQHIVAVQAADGTEIFQFPTEKAMEAFIAEARSKGAKCAIRIPGRQ